MTIETDRAPGNRAVVIGGSVAGLLAARVLSDHFDRVTIVERDRLPAGADNRKGVPHGRHAHALLPRGHMILERLFPGLSGDLVSLGAMTGDRGLVTRRHVPGGYLARFVTGKPGLYASRALLEGQLRRRVRELANVSVLEEHAVTGLLHDEAERHVSGATAGKRTEGSPVQELLADLVVDASGRGSRAPAWLEEMGYKPPHEERIEIGVGYTTRLYRSRPDDLPGTKICIIQPEPPRGRCAGAMFRIEGERWMVTLAGWLGERAPTDEAGFVEFARGLPAPDIYDVIKDAEALGEAVKYNFPANLRRRFEHLRRLPEGYLVVGDAMCSFNPIYGQGMSVSALEAEALDECLRKGHDGLPRRFYRRVSKIIDTPWKLAAGADFAHPGVTGNRGRANGIVNWYVGKLQRAATRDEAVCRAFMMVTGLISPPATLFHPRIAFRVLRQALAPRADAVTLPHQSVPEVVRTG